MTFTDWRNIYSPTLRRTAPTAIVHSGSRQTIFDCLCGSRHTCATDFNGRAAKHVREWQKLHNLSCNPIPKAIETEDKRQEIYSNDNH